MILIYTRRPTNENHNKWGGNNNVEDRSNTILRMNKSLLNPKAQAD